MYDEVITLIEELITTNDMGDHIPSTISKKDVFARVKSVGMKEKYQALANDISAELIFILADYLDYSGEKNIEYNEKQYHVIRTYQKEGTTELELVVSMDGGS